MAALVKINAMTDKVSCKAGASAECGFDVINPSDAKLRVGVEVVGEAKSWAKVQGSVEVDLPPRGQEKLKVNVSVPAKTEAKSYTLKLRVYDVQNPERAEESAAVAVIVPVEKTAEAPGAAPKKGPPWALIIGGIVGGLLLIGGIVTAIVLMSGGGPSVPDVVGMAQEDAQQALSAESLVVGKVTQEVSTDPEGTVIAQTPAAKAEVAEGAAVDLVVATAQPKEGVPNFVGQSLVDVLKQMNKAKLVQGTVGEQMSAEQSGTVIAQDPAAGARMPEDQTINLVISTLSVEVPRVLGFDVTAAKNALIAGGLDVGNVDMKETGNAHGGTVLEQSPESNQRALPGMKVNLVVEKTVVVVPAVKGVPYEEAKKRLDAVSLLVGKTDTANTGAADLTVVGQTPDEGTKVDPGSEVALLIEGAKTDVPDVVNQDLATATSLLTQKGLKVAAVTSVYSDATAGTIESQDPAANARVPPGTDVRLVQRAQRLVWSTGIIYMESKLVKNAVRLNKTAIGTRYVEPEDDGVAPAPEENEDQE